MVGVKMAYPNFEKLVGIISALRAPVTGCPWDLEQTHLTLLKYLTEESYEFIHAAELENDTAMEEEIGDVLLQVLLHGQIASERDAFDIESISEVLTEKLIRRHPHVFSDPAKYNLDAKGVLKNWDKIKKTEKNNRPNLFDDSYLTFPPLFSATKIGKKTSKVDFDWDSAGEVFKKVEEELNELSEEINAADKDQAKIDEEFGDLLFSMAQLGRHLNLDPEASLRAANKKFIRRFSAVEDAVAKDNKTWEKLSRQEKEAYWEIIKGRES